MKMTTRKLRSGADGHAGLPLTYRFETDPHAAGWESSGSYPSGAGTFIGEWSGTGGPGGRGCLGVRQGLWQTPPIPVRPLAYYRARFAARSAHTGFHAIRFHDAAGRELAADAYSAFDASADWEAHEVFTQAREDAVALRLAFVAGAGAARIADVTVTEATAADVLDWNDRLYSALPPVGVVPAPDRLRHLAGPLAHLRRGCVLRLLILGDSIANDTSNSHFHLFIQRRYPGADIRLLRSFRAATGCWFYRDHVREYVVDKQPDLVIVAGISHRNDSAAVRSVVEQTRRLAGRPVAFLVLTGAIMEPGLNGHAGREGAGRPAAERCRLALAAERQFYNELVGMQDELAIATLDVRSIWEDYLTGCGRPRAWFQRDDIHANDRGKQILGRILEQCFSPAAP